MKKLFALVFSFAILLIGKSYAINSAEYFVDAQAIEQTLNSGYQLDAANLKDTSIALETLHLLPEGASKVMADKDPLVAFLLGFFLGTLGIHRAYLGTSTGVIIGYIFTVGGCGILATIDWILLVIEVSSQKNFDSYVNNKKFFMWTN